MATETTPLSRTVDLTGLPEPVVEQVHRLVNDARNGCTDPLPTPPASVPQFAHVPPPLTAEEFSALLDEMAAMGSGQSLPLDWSRADLYEDHD